jgi:hypothetical protein
VASDGHEIRNARWFFLSSQYHIATSTLHFSVVSLEKPSAHGKTDRVLLDRVWSHPNLCYRFVCSASGSDSFSLASVSFPASLRDEQIGMVELLSTSPNF